jgi:hypothetical protein
MAGGCRCDSARDVITTLLGSQCSLAQALANNATIQAADSIAKCQEL